MLRAVAISLTDALPVRMSLSTWNCSTVIGNRSVAVARMWARTCPHTGGTVSQNRSSASSVIALVGEVVGDIIFSLVHKWLNS
jgi:hypothetical protein